MAFNELFLLDLSVPPLLPAATITKCQSLATQATIASQLAGQNMVVAQRRWGTGDTKGAKASYLAAKASMQLAIDKLNEAIALQFKNRK